MSSEKIPKVHTFEKSITYVIEHRSKQAGLKSAGVLAGFAFALATEEKFWESDTRISKMFDALNSGEGLVGGSPIQLLRNFFTSEEAKLFTASLNRGLAELVLQAVHLELQGQSPEKLEMSLDGADYFRSLQKERAGKIAELFNLPTNSRPQTIIKKLHEEKATEPKPKPTLDAIFKKAEIAFGIAGVIILGRGSNRHLDFVRAAIASVAFDYDYPVADVSLLIKRDAKKCADALPELLRGNDAKEFKSQFAYFQKSFR